MDLIGVGKRLLREQKRTVEKARDQKRVCRRKIKVDRLDIQGKWLKRAHVIGAIHGHFLKNAATPCIKGGGGL